MKLERYQCEFPFTGQYCEFIDKRSGKYLVKIFNNNEINKRPVEIDRARYRLCVKLKRFLNKDERVGYIDNNITNSDINNLYTVKVVLGENIKPEGIFKNKYAVYKYFSKGRFAVKIYSTARKRITMTYARYLMCMKENRILNSNEQVDHIDGNRKHDVIENLQILTPEQNIYKQYLNKEGFGTTRKIIKFICPICNKSVERRNAYGGFKEGRNKILFCGHRCLGIYGSKDTYVKQSLINDFKYEITDIPAVVFNVLELSYITQYGNILFKSNGASPYDIIDNEEFSQFTDIGVSPYDRISSCNFTQQGEMNA